MGAAVTAVVVPGVTNTTFQLAAYSENRRALSVFNDTGSAMVVKVGGGATPTSFTARIAAGALYQLPAADRTPNVITGAAVAITGNVMVTEVTA